jgi:small subunit ribosomal protein S4
MRAARQKGVTGENLLVLLERRLDNMVYRLGFANSRQQARQLVRHGHFQINGRKVNIPSYMVREGDEIVIKDKSRESATFLEAMEMAKRRGLASWLEVDPVAFKGIIKALPRREDLTMPIEEQLIVELYSK